MSRKLKYQTWTRATVGGRVQPQICLVEGERVILDWMSPTEARAIARRLLYEARQVRRWADEVLKLKRQRR